MPQVRGTFPELSNGVKKAMPRVKGKAHPHKEHTPIVSERQRGFFGAELGRREAGKKTRTKMSEAELRAHLKESRGHSLPSSSGETRKGRAGGMAERRAAARGRARGA